MDLEGDLEGGGPRGRSSKNSKGDMKRDLNQNLYNIHLEEEPEQCHLGACYLHM